MGIKYSNTLTVPGFHCDIKGTLTVPMLINYVLKISGEQTEQLEDNNNIISDNHSWIIIKYDIDIKRMPTKGETVEIVTDPVAYNKLFYYRDFFVYDHSGEEIARVRGIFALMDLNTRKMVRISTDIGEFYESEHMKKIMRGKSIDSLDTEKSTSKDYRVRYFDLDFNKHVNNSKYFEWVLDTLPPTFLYKYRVKSLSIKFSKEVHAEELVSSYVQIIEKKGNVKTLHKIQVGGKENCQAEIEWE